MIAWLLHLIGVSSEFTTNLDQVSLDAQYRVVFWVGVLLLVPVSFLIYWWQRRTLFTAPPSLRIALSATRIFVLFMLVAVASGPFIRLDQQLEKKPIVALLFDQSQSMYLPAGATDAEADLAKLAQAAGYSTPEGKVDAETRKALARITRLGLTTSVVRHSTDSLLAPLAKKFDVKYYGFARDVNQFAVGAEPAKPQLPEPAATGGPATHLGDAVDHVLTEAAGRQVAGILIFSDGQNTGGRSPVAVAGAAAAVATPLFPVPAGSTVRFSDVSIVDVFATDLVSVGDTARVAVTIESQGFDKRPVKVELRDGDTLLDSKDLILRAAEQQQVELTFQAKDPGAKYLTVAVPPLPEEPEHLRGNNFDTAFIRISEEKLKVLYVEGLPRWDFRFLKNAMRRDHGLGGRGGTGKEADVVLEAELRRASAAEQAEALPRTLDALAEYHTVILGDVSPAVLTPTFLELLDQAVRERGVGLIIAAGPLAMPHAYGSKLLDLLPVKTKAKVAGIEAPVYKPFKLELTPDGAVHESMRFYDDLGRNQNSWGHMPPYYWCVAAERPAPAATVLAWNPSIQNGYGKLPLIAQHYVGVGKVMLVGIDSTWTWRQNVGDRFFYKFWGQSIRSLARRDKAGAKKSWLEVRPVRAQPGEQATIELMAYRADGTPRTEDSLPVRLLAGGSAGTFTLLADKGTKGRFTGKFIVQSAGEYRLAYDPGAGVEPIEAKIRVMLAPEELRFPNVNRPALQMLASKSAGRMVELADLGTIPDQLVGDSKQTQLHREATLWDNWLVLSLLIFVYSLDVGLRRLAGLS